MCLTIVPVRCFAIATDLGIRQVGVKLGNECRDLLLYLYIERSQRHASNGNDKQSRVLCHLRPSGTSIN